MSVLNPTVSLLLINIFSDIKNKYLMVHSKVVYFNI